MLECVKTRNACRVYCENFKGRRDQLGNRGIYCRMILALEAVV
jgi:hypothetical protein